MIHKQSLTTQHRLWRVGSREATIVTDIIKCISKLRVTVSENYNNIPQNLALVIH